MAKLAPSILSADFSKLAEELYAVEKAGADYVHIDVMDGHFVPNISFGAQVMKCLEGKIKMPFDVHLMIEDPCKYIKDFVTDDTEYITVHQEACAHLDRMIEYIRSFGIKAGVSINPATPVETLECILGKVDLVLVMSVNPGFGGQTFIPYVYEKIKKLDGIRKARNLSFEIEVDGGADLTNVKKLAVCGTDIVVAGSAIFNSEDIEKTAAAIIGELA